MADATDPDIVLQVTIRTEDLDASTQALDVVVTIADDVSAEWAIDFLHQIADDYAKKIATEGDTRG